jgi:hypothetical protein
MHLKVLCDFRRNDRLIRHFGIVDKTNLAKYQLLECSIFVLINCQNRRKNRC